jgi:hypothetical protein
MKDPQQLIESEEILQEMSDWLAREGYKEAANGTQSLIEEIRIFINRIEAKAESLQDVWKAVEWYSSSDWGKDSVDEAVENYGKR